MSSRSVLGNRRYLYRGCSGLRRRRGPEWWAAVKGWPVSGCYLLLVGLPRRVCLKVGFLGPVCFQRGTYVYVGRAKRGLKARISRHLNYYKRGRWHVDMLVGDGQVLAVAVVDTLAECGLARAVGKVLGKAPVVRGFGASDCSCFSHLFFVSPGPGYGMRRFESGIVELQGKMGREILVSCF